MKRRITLTEGDLHRIIIESVNNVLLQEGFGDKINGAISGWQTGRRQQQDTEEGTNFLWSWARSAQRVLSQQNPQACMEWMANFIKALEKSGRQGTWY